MNVEYKCDREGCGSKVFAQPNAPINKLPCHLNLSMGKESPDSCGLKQVEEWHGDDPMHGYDGVDDKPSRDHRDERLRTEMYNVEDDVKLEAVNQSGEPKRELMVEPTEVAERRTAKEMKSQEGFDEPKNKAQLEADEAQAKKQKDRDRKQADEVAKAEPKQAEAKSTDDKADSKSDDKPSGDKVTKSTSSSTSAKRSR